MAHFKVPSLLATVILATLLIGVAFADDYTCGQPWAMSNEVIKQTGTVQRTDSNVYSYDWPPKNMLCKCGYQIHYIMAKDMSNSGSASVKHGGCGQSMAIIDLKPKQSMIDYEITIHAHCNHSRGDCVN